MTVRVEAEDGFGLIELMVAVTVLTIALLALAAGYDQAFLSLHRASQKSVASSLADQQLELYRSLPYDSIGLDATAVANATTAGSGSYDATYASDKATLAAADPIGTTDETITGCGSTPQCSPVQTVTGSDHRSYRLETFIRNAPVSVTGVSWSERIVTVILRDPSAAGSPLILQQTSAIDRAAG